MSARQKRTWGLANNFLGCLRAKRVHWRLITIHFLDCIMAGCCKGGKI